MDVNVMIAIFDSLESYS